MSALAIGAGVRDDPRIALDRDERLGALFAPVRGMSSVMALVAAGSFAVHALLVATAVVSARAPLPAPKEIAVEIVREVPKAAPPKPLPEPAPDPSKSIQAAAAKPAPPPAQPARPQPEPAKTKAADVPKPAPAAVLPRPSADETALQKELERLRAEQAELKSELATPPAAKSDMMQDGSGKALALAAAGEGGIDPVGYEQLVFSQLAKAKDRAGFHGSVGTTLVRFEIAATGALAAVAVATPSGDRDLDREAIAIVQRAAPFPPPPKDASRVVFANVNFVPPKGP